MWVAFVVAPLLALVNSLLFIRLRYGKNMFPYLLGTTDTDIVVMDGPLTPETCAQFSERVDELLHEHEYPKDTAMKAALFTEEIGLTILEKNDKKKLQIEIFLFFENDSVLLIERDSGAIFDLTDPDLKIDGLSSFILSRLMEAHPEKAYLTTNGYNRIMMRFT